ncbi:MAG TPA: shikimate dehydrogenase [Burkholderiales bacterium]|nr:shikimate dehydrogenase [Burkholderiales bacterium]
MSSRYAVIGNPIGHSLSPVIHAAFAQSCGVDMTYTAILSPLDEFSKTVNQFRAAGGRGLNVTVPFKIEAFNLASSLTCRAEEAQAVNTLKFCEEGILGDNTDGAGLVRDLEINAKFSIEGKRILVMGAGGAARGIIGPFMDRRPKGLWLANRTFEKALVLAKMRPGIEVLPFVIPADFEFDLVINASTSSLKDDRLNMPRGLFAKNALACDLMYFHKPSGWLRLAQSTGAARVRDGLGMLIEQAAESFYLWHGVRPQTAPVFIRFAEEMTGRAPDGGFITEKY